MIACSLVLLNNCWQCWHNLASFWRLTWHPFKRTCEMRKRSTKSLLVATPRHHAVHFEWYRLRARGLRTFRVSSIGSATRLEGHTKGRVWNKVFLWSPGSTAVACPTPTELPLTCQLACEPGMSDQHVDLMMGQVETLLWHFCLLKDAIITHPQLVNFLFSCFLRIKNLKMPLRSAISYSLLFASLVICIFTCGEQRL